MKQSKNTVCHLLLVALLLIIITTKITAQNNSNNNNLIVFSEDVNFPRQEKNLRKWDAPVVADLDQDGYQDLLINDHGFGIQVQWNNNGKFAKPYDIIMGDLHGVSIADFDKDGHIEVIMSRGGGSGSNARNSKMYRVVGREFVPLPDFKEPLALMRGRTVKFIDGNNDGYLDLLNFAFPDASKKGASENYIYKNNTNGELILHDTLPAIKGNGQKTLVTDFNNDNVLDIILYGSGKTTAFKGNGNLTYTEVTKNIFPFDIEETTSISEIDFDNDGDFDLFITRGKNEFEKGETFYNEAEKTVGFFTTRGQFEFDDFETGDVLKLENMQSQWPNNDTYFLGETGYSYDFEGETHSGKNIKLVNSNALGFPDNTNYKEKKGWYIGYVGNKKWRIAGYLWAPSTGVVHNVSNYKKHKHNEGFKNILLENKKGAFKDASHKLNTIKKEHAVASAVADFNNDGLKDILVIKRGELVYKNEALLYVNTNNKGFYLQQKHGVITNDLGALGMAVEVVDFDEDGSVDVVMGNERGKWHLFKNLSSKTSNNKFINIKVGKSPKNNVSPLGAKVTMSSCGVNQTYRIGTTNAQYSQGHNNLVHFGLSSCNKLIHVKVTWINGEVINKTFNLANKTFFLGNK
ncbi:CRTAC1 family protein [Seonamhaeicola algicola]|uniref:CRTAC1 family protein n=1 Tax=Seonamhaeicola algicola TaxID=1719036 RepID=A0A5C7AN17_9FLAO|nr:CRTAC1 family protein [Seonamhaeicola algicola]TXE10156.1 CRTAC1 family protein [Seonamhaeicola algicola]